MKEGGEKGELRGRDGERREKRERLRKRGGERERGEREVEK